MFFWIALTAWFLLALVAGATGLVATLRPPGPQILVVVLTLSLLIAARFSAAFRGWLMARNWRIVVGFHLLRFIGFYFLFLYSRGELPYDFAVPGGIGDIGVASAALLLLVFHEAAARSPKLIVGWNILGLADILFVVVTAERLSLADPGSMSALVHLPLSLLISFVVPLIITSHIWMLMRYRRRAAGTFP